MKLTLTKREHALLLAALAGAVEYESSIADAWKIADRKVAARSRRRVKSYRRLRAKL